MAFDQAALPGRSAHETRHTLRRQLWLWPSIAAAVLLAVGVALNSFLSRAVEKQVRANLETIRDTTMFALRAWFEVQRQQAEIAAADQQVHDSVIALAQLAASRGADAAEVRNAAAQQTLRDEMKRFLEHGYTGYVVVDRQWQIVGAPRDELIGQSLFGYEKDVFLKAFDPQNTSVVSQPLRTQLAVPLGDSLGPETPIMFAIAPVHDDEGAVVGAVGLRMSPEGGFTLLLNMGRIGQSGESYAFDRQGLMLSPSRFEDELAAAGLLPEPSGLGMPSEKSPLNVELRDPGVNLKSGRRAARPRNEQPLTVMAQAATDTRESGSNVAGYNDYRGVPVVGAWTWLKDYDFGLATEIDYDEAYAPLTIVHQVFWGLFALLVVSTAIIFIVTLLLERSQVEARRAVLEARRLGQYTLDEKIGEGGMGSVYSGHHAMLRRPTAVKLLDPERTNGATIARFEREVQLTSRLNHPNTIAIYDYGRTPEGVFYYAMEFLDGIDLERLVTKHGPQPDGRVVHVLMQICNSLHEAHSVGLIHRDIKPANVMLNARGGLFDVVKVLDFGLVKAEGAQNDSGVTLAGSVLGTPHYMSPEAILDRDQVDSRSDLYAVGAVGYFLLTGTTVFSGEDSLAVCGKQVHQAPEPPSRRLGQPISAALERLIMDCLAKDPSLRPQSASEMAVELARCLVEHPWTALDAEAWWRENPPRSARSSTLPATDEIHVAETIIAAPGRRF